MSSSTESVGDGDGVSRRTIIRLLVGLGIGIPVLIEAVTFLGLIGDRLSPTEPGEGSGSRDDDAVGVGMDVLPASPVAETVTHAIVLAGDVDWLFELDVTVENTADEAYSFALTRVRTGNDRVVEGGSTTGPVAPGEETSLSARFTLEVGETPVAVYAAGELGDERFEEWVSLAKVPVQRT